jgi:hypothetical protein
MTGRAFLRYQSPKGPRHEAFVCIVPKGEAPGVVVVEGPLDALAAGDAGYIGVALMGMIPSRAILQHIAMHLADTNPWKPTLVVLDRGEGANSAKVAVQLAAIGMPVRSVEPDTKDLAECLPHKREKFLSQKFSSLFRPNLFRKPQNKDLRA